MAKYSPKVPFVSGGGHDPSINIDSDKWRQIEKAYDSSLLPNVRADIVRATAEFLFLESFERTVEPLAKVKVILEAHDKAATRFFNELFASPSAGSDADAGRMQAPHAFRGCPGRRYLRGAKKSGPRISEAPKSGAIRPRAAPQ